MRHALEPLSHMPDKLYLTIKEVSERLNVAPHVLRYWEKEFPQIAPVKRAGNRRFYKKRDLDALLEVRHLLYDRRFTVAGARKYLRHKKQVHDPFDLLDIVRKELLEIQALLHSGTSSTTDLRRSK